MQVVSINQRNLKDIQEEEQKKAMMTVIDYMKTAIEQGEIKEFVATSVSDDGTCQIHVAAMDLPGSIGLFEIGKHMLINSETDFE